MSALRVVSICAVAGALAVAPAPLAARQFQARPTEGFVMPLADGRMAVLLTRDGGVVVDGIVAGDQPPGGPETDLRYGDRVVSFQQNERPTLAAVAQAWERIADSATVTIGVERSGARYSISFRKPATRGTPMMRMAVAGQDGAGTGAWVGAGGGSSGTTEVVIAGNHIRENDQGMPYVAFRASDPGATAVGLRTGDVVTHFNGRSLAALRGLEMFYNSTAAGQEISLTVQRGASSETVRFRKPAL